MPAPEVYIKSSPPPGTMFFMISESLTLSMKAWTGNPQHSLHGMLKIPSPAFFPHRIYRTKNKLEGIRMFACAKHAVSRCFFVCFPGLLPPYTPLKSSVEPTWRRYCFNKLFVYGLKRRKLLQCVVLSFVFAWRFGTRR